MQLILKFPRADRLLLALAFSFLFVGCGNEESGTWEDNESNWMRAFGEPKPDGIEVVRSRYMSTAHWSNEYEFFFHVRPSAAATQRFATPPKMKRYTSEDDLFLPVDSFFEPKPDWFLPRELGAYDIWIRQQAPRGNLRVFQDRETGDLFITENQI